MDSTFLQELYLQCFPSLVRMVLASTPDMVSLSGMAKLDDKILKVAALMVSAVPILYISTQVEQLKAEVTRLLDYQYTLVC